MTASLKEACLEDRLMVMENPSNYADLLDMFLLAENQEKLVFDENLTFPVTCELKIRSMKFFFQWFEFEIISETEPFSS